MTNILLTGASGFMGRHVAQRLLSGGHRLFCPLRQETIDALPAPLKHTNCKIMPGLFYDPAVLDTISDKDIQVVIHLAALRGEGQGDADWYQRINVEGTRTLWNWAAENQIKRAIYCSTVGVWGTIPKQLPATTDLPPQADGLYHRSKWQAEEIVQTYEKQGVNSVILRPTITYGAGDDGFIPRMIAMIQKHRFVLDRSDVYIHLLNVNSFAGLIPGITDNNQFTNKTYAVADYEPVSLKTVSDLICQVCGGGYMTVPHFFFKFGKLALALSRQQKIMTSVRLISESWHYDIAPAISDLGYQPQKTTEALKAVIGEICNG